jgi:RNA polymerase sigma-70 factor, ECF subfamily
MEYIYQAPTEHADTSLIEQALNRDPEAFTSLYELYVERVFRHVYYHLSDRSEAEDITQEVFVRAWKAISHYKNTGAPFMAWLITIARHLITDHFRSTKRLVTLTDMGMIECEGADPEQIVADNLNRSFMRNAIMKLKGEKKDVILMRFIDGFTYEEIAKALNKSEGAVRVIQFRALKDLKQILGSPKK